MRFPSKRPTPAQWIVCAWTVILVFLALAAIGFFYSLGQSPQNAEAVRQLRILSSVCLGLGALVFVAKELVQRLRG